jgi:uncharacterized repeat protein (TIGR01451 family)
LTYTVVIRNDGSSFADTIYVTDTVPVGLSYIAGTLTATLGAVDDSAAPALYWTGSLGSVPAVTLTYVVMVVETDAHLISNTVTINAGTAGTLTRSATVIANGHSAYLPLVLKGD